MHQWTPNTWMTVNEKPGQGIFKKLYYLFISVWIIAVSSKANIMPMNGGINLHAEPFQNVFIWNVITCN